MTKRIILFLAANPNGTSELALGKEARAIQEAIERSGDHSLKLETRWAVQPLDLLRELRKLKPTVVHFSGHGGLSSVGAGSAVATVPRDVNAGTGASDHDRQPGLIFQSSDGCAQVVTAQVLHDTFGAAGASVKLVVLSACYSDVHAETLRTHVHCVVGMRGSIGDDAARSFAIGFYGGLGDRESIAAAFSQGCAAIGLEGLPDRDRPQLLVRDGVDASQLVLGDTPNNPEINPDTAVASAELDYHRRATARVYGEFRWAKDPIPLTVTDHGSGGLRDARAALVDWVRSPKQHCQLLGDFGAGKTGLLVWLASRLVSDIHDGLVLLVPASRITASIASISDLASVAEPPFTPIASSTHVYHGCYLLLDGFDELIGTLLGGITRAKEALDAVLAVVPVSTRIVLSCRTPVYKMIEDDVSHGLASVALPKSPYFAADCAIDEVLGDTSTNVATYTVLPVREHDARRFLNDNVPTAAEAFLERPFTLTLLQAATSRIRSPRHLTIDELYEKAISALLRRDRPAMDIDKRASVSQYRDKLNAVSATIEKIVIQFEEIAVAKFFGTATADQMQALKRAQGTLDHYSYWEFLFARRLARQIGAFDATILAHVDLVSAYNVNRVLVPMLLRQVAGRGAQRGIVRPVLASEYARFVEETGWRRSTGYGARPSMLRGHDGNVSTTFAITDSELDAIHQRSLPTGEVAEGVSWYDVVAFVLWKGVALPSSTEVKSLLGVTSHVFWCADWHTESRAHVVGFDAVTGVAEGVNPDVRLPRMAAAIVDTHFER